LNRSGAFGLLTGQIWWPKWLISQKGLKEGEATTAVALSCLSWFLLVQELAQSSVNIEMQYRSETSLVFFLKELPNSVYTWQLS